MDNPPLTRPRIYLIRMAVFLVLAGFVAFILYRQIWNAFLANPGLNALIIGVMLIGVILAIRQVWRLFPEVRWVNTLNRAEEGASSVRLRVLTQRTSGNRRQTCRTASTIPISITPMIRALSPGLARKAAQICRYRMNATKPASTRNTAMRTR